MATTTITNVCRRDWLSGSVFDMSTDTIKMALYNGSGHDATTTQYSATSESAGAGYSATGVTMAGITENLDSSNNVAYLDWSTDPSWTSSTITSTDCLIYNNTVTTPTNLPAMYVGDFSGSRSSNNGTFQVVLPLPAYNTAIMRIA